MGRVRSGGGILGFAAVPEGGAPPQATFIPAHLPLSRRQQVSGGGSPHVEVLVCYDCHFSNLLAEVADGSLAGILKEKKKYDKCLKGFL